MKIPVLKISGLTLAVSLIVAAAAFALKAVNSASEPALAADPGLHNGLAARYPGDKGLAADSAVVFYEDFESGDVSGLSTRWTSMNNKDSQVLDFVKDSIPGSAGRRSLRVTGTKGHDTGGDLWKKLERGYDQLYARFYCKFAADAPYVHHFVHLGGTTSTAPYPEGHAGSSPSGYDHFSTSIDLERSNTLPPGAWFFYSYWSEMHSWQNADGSGTSFYGNPFRPDTAWQALRGTWQCVEIMIKLNHPDSANGEQALWVDGRLATRWGPGTHTGTWFKDAFRTSGIFNTDPKPFEGFRWRKTENLKINTLWLQYYLASIFEENVRPTDPTIPYNGNVGRVEFDNVVLATRYIGPLATAVTTGYDYNGDGRKSLADVWSFLRIRVNDRSDMRADYNGDGQVNVRDLLALLLDVVKP
jgi:hypothetical protein